MYERYMRIIGHGDEIDVIKRECAEAYEREQKEEWCLMNLAFKYTDLFASKGSPEELVEKIGTLKPEKLKVLINPHWPTWNVFKIDGDADFCNKELRKAA